MSLHDAVKLFEKRNTPEKEGLLTFHQCCLDCKVTDFWAILDLDSITPFSKIEDEPDYEGYFQTIDYVEDAIIVKGERLPPSENETDTVYDENIEWNIDSDVALIGEWSTIRMDNVASFLENPTKDAAWYPRYEYPYFCRRKWIEHIQKENSWLPDKMYCGSVAALKIQVMISL